MSNHTNENEGPEHVSSSPVLTSHQKLDLELSGPPTLYPGEDRDRYDRLFNSVANEVNPADIFEQIWVRDIVDQTWEVWRYRQQGADLVAAKEQTALERVLRQLLGKDPMGLEGFGMTEPERMAWKYASNDEVTVARVDELLKSTRVGWKAVYAEALASCIDEIESLNQMMVNAELRRNTTLRQIESRRATFGQRMRDAVEQVDEMARPTIAHQPHDEKRAA